MWPLLLTLFIAATVGLGTALAMKTLGPKQAETPSGPGIDADEGSELQAKAIRVVALPFIAIALGVVIAVLGALMILVERNSYVRRWDEHVEEWAVRNAGEQATTALTWITHLGDTLTIAVLVSLSVAVVLTTRRDWSTIGFLVSVAVGQWLVVNTIKWAYDRARPNLDPLTDFSGASFPSGHSAAAAASYLAVALVMSGYVHHRWKAILVGAAVGIAVAVACSRALLGVHWLTDVIGGLVLGWTWCLICWTLFTPRGPVHALWGPFRGSGVASARTR